MDIMIKQEYLQPFILASIKERPKDGCTTRRALAQRTMDLGDARMSMILIANERSVHAYGVVFINSRTKAQECP